MRRLLTIFLSGVVLLSLISCSSSPTPSTTISEITIYTGKTEETELQPVAESESTVPATKTQAHTTVETPQTADDHIFIAFAKMPNGDGSTSGFINEKGEFVMIDNTNSITFASISSNGFLGIKWGGDFGWYTDSNFESVFGGSFCYIGEFSHGLAPVAEGSYNGGGVLQNIYYKYINEIGETVIAPTSDYYKFYEAGPFADNGLAVIQYQGSRRFIDTEGNHACGGKTFINAFSFCNGLAGVLTTAENGEELWGYIDESGEYVIDLQYAAVSPFSKNGYALVRDQADEHTGIIDKTGTWLTTIDDSIIIPFSYYPDSGCSREAYFSDNGLAVCFSYGPDGEYSTDDLYGYINESGSIVIPCQFSHADPFALNGLASVCVDDGSFLYGYINSTGSFVIDPVFSQADNFALFGDSSKDFSNPVPVETNAIPTESSGIPTESIFIPEDIGDPVNTAEMYSCFAHMTSFDPNTGWAEFDYFLMLFGEEAIQWIMERDGLTYDQAYQYYYAEENADKFTYGISKNTNPQLRTIDLHDVILKLVHYPIVDIIGIPEGNSNSIEIDFPSLMRVYYKDPAILTDFYYYITVDEKGVPTTVEQIFRS